MNMEDVEDDPLAFDLALAQALAMTAMPPQAWIEAAAMLPSTLGDLDAVDRLVSLPSFREAFENDPESALSGAGLPASKAVVTALRERLLAG